MAINNDTPIRLMGLLGGWSDQEIHEAEKVQRKQRKADTDKKGGE